MIAAISTSRIDLAPVPPPVLGITGQRKEATRLVESILAIYADALDDIEHTRLATESRLRALIQVKGMAGSLEAARMAALVDQLRALEHERILELQRTMRAHPLGPWQRSRLGVGEKQLARLLAVIGNPHWHRLYDRPRTVSELWAFCGLHVFHPGHQSHADTHFLSAGVEISNRSGTAPRLIRGESINWSTNAKTRAILIAGSCIKHVNGPYRVVYLTRRARTAITHPDWTKLHSHNDGLRITAKAILRDLWVEGGRLHKAEN